MEEVRQLEKANGAVKVGVHDADERENKDKDLEYKIKNAKAIKEKELKEADAEVKKFKKAWITAGCSGAEG